MDITMNLRSMNMKPFQGSIVIEPIHSQRLDWGCGGLAGSPAPAELKIRLVAGEAPYLRE